jgi:hypothetical protein
MIAGRHAEGDHVGQRIELGAEAAFARSSRAMRPSIPSSTPAMMMTATAFSHSPEMAKRTPVRPKHRPARHRIGRDTAQAACHGAWAGNPHGERPPSLSDADTLAVADPRQHVSPATERWPSATWARFLRADRHRRGCRSGSGRQRWPAAIISPCFTKGMIRRATRPAIWVKPMRVPSAPRPEYAGAHSLRLPCRGSALRNLPEYRRRA